MSLIKRKKGKKKKIDSFTIIVFAWVYLVSEQFSHFTEKTNSLFPLTQRALMHRIQIHLLKTNLKKASFPNPPFGKCCYLCYHVERSIHFREESEYPSTGLPDSGEFWVSGHQIGGNSNPTVVSSKCMKREINMCLVMLLQITVGRRLENFILMILTECLFNACQQQPIKVLAAQAKISFQITQMQTLRTNYTPSLTFHLHLN